tara:strand:- start:36705 stop:37091 length:387 start_codon:yes stop_codon:yes gene_type:complete
MDRVRIDKWLWAARFFRTRALAKDAIEGGKIHVNGQRTKPSKEIKVGESVVIRQGWTEKQVIVEGLSDSRGGAPEAAKLYTETNDSVTKREQALAERQAIGTGHQPATNKPSKKQRRQIERLREHDDY